LNIKAPDDFASAAEWANAYRALGLAVIPASGNKKIPLGEWKEFQGGIPQPVHDRWYGAGGDNLSNYRMGFLTGAASIGDGWKLLLIDLDEKGKISGNATWDHWIGENELGVDPETWRARTGGGGQHIYFKYPAGLHIRNTQETIAGIDVRAEGGFVIAPPSLHASGKPYTWLYSPFETELAEAPQWLLDKVGASTRSFDASPREKGATPEHATDGWGNIVDGRDAYMRDVVWAAVVDLYRECPIPPSAAESDAKCREAYATYERRVRPQDPGKTLEEEGRGLTAFRQKWAYAVKQWDTKVHEAAGYPSFKDRPPTWDFDDELIARKVELPKSTPAESTSLVEPLEVVSAASFAGQPPPERKWIVPDLIPDGVPTLISGDGGVGKSLLALQLAAAIDRDGFWAGKKVAAGKALYLSAEDEIDELNRRLIDIAACIGCEMSELTGLDIVPLAGKDAVLAAPDPKSQLLYPTTIMKRLRATIAARKPTLVILDTSADLYGGNENVRIHVRQFIGMLRALCIDFQCAVVLLSHPSVAGINSGTGLSGSTAWNGSVRSRLYLDRVTEKDGDATLEPDPTLRVLRTMKANYGPTDKDGIKLRWVNGAFKPAISGATFQSTGAQMRAERVFLNLLAMYTNEGRAVTSTTGHGYAPAVFAADKRSEGCGKRALADAMNALFQQQRITAVEYGPPSKRYSKLAIREGE